MTPRDSILQDDCTNYNTAIAKARGQQ